MTAAVLERPDAPRALRRAFALGRGNECGRHHEIADQLGVPPGALIAAHAGRPVRMDAPMRAIPLQPRWPALVAAAATLGEVLARTANRSCTLEVTGSYGAAQLHGDTGQVQGRDIDLHLFYSAWAKGFAVHETGPAGLRRSLQFFDNQGQPVHEIALGARSRPVAFDTLVARFAAAGTATGATPAELHADDAETPPPQVDLRAFRAGWASMRAPCDLFGLLRRHGLSRLQALRLAAPEFATEVDPGAAQELLSRAAQTGMPLELCTGNPGAVQRHVGPVRRVAVEGPWLRLRDPQLRLDLREDHIASAWWVRQPSTEGLVSSLELFDAQGRTLALFTGARQPGQPECCAWRSLLASVAQADDACSVRH